MQRLLAEVRKKELERRYRAKNGLEYGRYTLRVRVVGSAVDALTVPRRVVGRDTSVRRDFLMPWVVKKGDLVALGPDESARLLKPRRARLAEGLPTGACVRAEFGDVDRDGYKEDVMANRFARAVLAPHRGARLSSLSGPDGVDRFAHPFDYTMAGKYILLGGAEQLIVEDGSPGEIWKSEFDRTVDEESPEIFEATYVRKLKSIKGLRVATTVRMEPDLPGVLGTYDVRYDGKPAPDEPDDGADDSAKPGGSERNGDEQEKKKDETEVTFALRLATATPGETPSLNVFEIPCADGVHLVRYHPPGFGRRWRWRDWRDEHFGLRGGFLVSRNEVSGNVLVVLFNGRRASFVSVRPDYTGPEVGLVHRTRKLGKGRGFRLGVTFLVGDAVAVGRGSMLLASLGSPHRGRRPLALTLRTGASPDRVRARVTSREGSEALTLRKRSLPEAGDVYTGILELRRGAFPLTVSVTDGKVRLSLELEG